MHELSIAMSIIDLAEEEASARHARVTAVHLRVGRLSGVVKDALLACYDMAAEGTSLAGSRLEIEDVPAFGTCLRCNGPRPVREPDWFLCPECREPISEIIQGRDLQVFALEFAA
jgi:hydrogenase nickel incorporation protein HypA/HybF